MSGVLRLSPLVAVVLLAGCGQYVTVAEGPSRDTVVSEGILSASASPLPDGSVNLRVHRGTSIRREQDFVRRHAGDSTRDLATVYGPPGVQVADAAWTSLLFSELMVIPAYAAVGLAVLAYEGIAYLAVEISTYMAGRFPSGETRRTEIRVETEWVPSPGVALETADGSVHVDLGPQPFGGYDLDAQTIRRFGPAGSTVVVRDGERWTIVVFEAPRPPK